MDEREIVPALRAALAERVGRDRFELWFGANTRFCLRDNVLTIEVPNRFSQDWLRSNFRKEIESACEEAVGRPVGLEFRVDEALGQAKPAPKKAAAPEAPVASPAAVPARTTQAAAPQAAEPLGRRRYASLETFVVGSSNRMAHAAAQMAIERPGYYSPLVVYGPTGTGKTHLLESIWSGTRDRRRTARTFFLSAEQFTTYFLEALRGSGLPSFRRKYRDVELLVIDDVQFFAGKRATLVELLHTIDTLTKEGRQLVFSTDRPPAELKELGPEVTNRLAGGMLCRLEQPDLATRRGIVQQFAAKLDMTLPEDVQDYVATQLTTHARELSGAMNRLHATSMAWKAPVTRAMAEEALGEMTRYGSRTLKLADIERAVCDAFGLEATSLQSDRKAKQVNQPRMLAMWLARKHTRAALSEIGQYFGRRSHSTVISAQKKVGQWMSEQAGLDVADKRLSVEDAIRRVEDVLRAG